VIKPVGKKDMYRSKPARKKQVKEEEVRDEEAEDIKKFFT
jgi:hypothetical protein